MRVFKNYEWNNSVNSELALLNQKMDFFSGYFNKLVNSSLPSQHEKSLEENISLLKKNLCMKEEIIKKLVETQNTVLNTISAKSNNQHSNILNQSSFSLPSNNLNENSHNTGTARSTCRATLFFTTAKNIASYPSSSPKTWAKYRSEKHICGKSTERYHQTRYLWTFWFKLGILFTRYMQYRFSYK